MWNLVPAVLLLPFLRLLEGVGRVRGKGEIGSRALAAVADRAAEAVDRVRAVGVEVEPGLDHLARGIDGRARRGQERMRREDRRHRLAVGLLVVAEPVDPLVAGRAAVVAGHFLEVVVDRQLGEADLLDLGRRHQVDAGKAAEERHRAAVPVSAGRRRAHPSARSPAATRSASRVSRSLLLLELVDVAEQLFLLVLLGLQLGLGRLRVPWRAR